MARLICHVGDKLLLKASVYAADGVTVATPTSGIVDIFNQDDGTQLVSDGACQVGSGYCQYNLTTTTTAGRYVAFMQVVVAADTTQTERFEFTISEVEA